ncbi:MAG: SAM-dependent methyltransferase [Flavobacteriales bacterium]|jgi:16S rRNA (cytidine1402-2'-O)-methyltransferase|nr:SAM-dependent methyltransferase [Flavobacteriales bacterium]
MNKGTLYLIPNTLGDSNLNKTIPEEVQQKIQELDHFVVEHSKPARAFLKSVGIKTPQSDLVIFELNKHTDPADISSFINPLLKGIDIGLLSDAGCPGVADPGADIVKLAHQNHIRVTPFVGPSSILLAQMASGLNGQSFAFNGYLPIDKIDRKKQIQFFENLAKKGQSQSFIETPYRNKQLFQELLNHLNPKTQLCIAYHLTLTDEFIKTQSVQDWKKTALPDFHKKPCIFIIG